MPSLSKRISIAWDGGPPYEDTDTLVIVGDTYFVDVRIKRSSGDLDWALAGVKEWVHKEPEPPKARFTPILTSRTPPPGQPIADEGTFSDLPNGDSLEVGVMYDPEDGRVKPYEEVWRDLPALGVAFILEVIEQSKAIEEDTRVENAWIAQMGDHQLMVAKLSSGTYAAWTAVRLRDDSHLWQIRSSVGDPSITAMVPPVYVSDDLWKAGEKVEIAGREWLVKECFKMA